MPSLTPRLTQKGFQGGRVLPNSAPTKVDADRRGTAHERGYDSRWRKTRLGYFAKHPLCVCCEANGRVTVATVLDHIIPHKLDWDLFWTRSNWQGLCASCHNVVKARLEKRWHAGKLTDDDLKLARDLPEFFVPE